MTSSSKVSSNWFGSDLNTVTITFSEASRIFFSPMSPQANSSDEQCINVLGIPVTYL